MLLSPWVSCSTTALFPPPVTPLWLSVHCAEATGVLLADPSPPTRCWGSTLSNTLPGRELHTGQAHICELISPSGLSLQRQVAESTSFWEKRNLLQDTSAKPFVPKSHVQPASSLMGPALDFGKHCVNLLHAVCLIPVRVPPWGTTR